MPLYLVSYDLRHKNVLGDYDNLVDELQRLNAVELLEARWLLRTKNEAAEVRNHLGKMVHPEDRLLVTEIGDKWAGRNLLVDPERGLAVGQGSVRTPDCSSFQVRVNT
jgi:hypothetical protein